MVEVRHLDVWGTICPEGFDDRDAKVLCRELGLKNGFAYYKYDHRFKAGETLPWLSHLNCTGSEGYLARCGNIRWGDVRDCSVATKAAVYCAENAGEFLPIMIRAIPKLLVFLFKLSLQSHKNWTVF